ncbi:MAG: LysM peptidoglycan-binding domain-containing protein [Anaerolineaceae bacterium]|nr:LysM peptidoglycan-binding domain-containing protein [Anaerolineaceae bacterium]
MHRRWRFIFLYLILAGLALSACASGTPATHENPTGTPEGTLRLFPTDTPTGTPLPTGYVTATPSPTITPTPTQVYYEVQLNDDMYAIAFRYGLEPQAIMTANPDVNPNAMVVGMQLLIPVTPSPEPTATPTTNATAAAEETNTPAPQAVTLHEPDCYPDAAGGLWCFILAENENDSPRENVAAQVTLTDGETTRQETAIMSLNLLPSGAVLPLIAYFQGTLPAQYTISAELDFFLPVMPDDARYLAVEIKDDAVEISVDGAIAHATGILALSGEQRDAQYTWVSATALDAEGHVVAVRRWDATVPLVAGGELPFEISLYSFSGEIDRVILMAEAQPVLEAGE